MWLPTVLGVYVLLGLSTVFGGWGLVHLRGLTQEQAALEAAVFARLRESQALRVCMKRLETDDTFLEHIAREEFGFVRPDDIVYRFDAPTGRVAAALAADVSEPFPGQRPGLGRRCTRWP